MNIDLESEPGQVIDPRSDAGGRLPGGEFVFPSVNGDISVYTHCESYFINRQDRGLLCLSVHGRLCGRVQD